MSSKIELKRVNGSVKKEANGSCANKGVVNVLLRVGRWWG